MEPDFRETKEEEKAMNILEEANKAVGGDRGEAYGHPADDFQKVVGAANALGVNPLSGPLHHSLYMVLVKISRLVQTPTHHDSIVDIAGYARTYEMVLEREEKHDFTDGGNIVLTEEENPRDWDMRGVNG